MSAGEMDKFVVIILRLADRADPRSQEFLDGLDCCIRASGGRIQLKSQATEEWQVYDGKDHFTAPNHLSPAIFDFNCIVVAAFRSFEEMYHWWNSEQMFNTLKNRTAAEKIGIYGFEGLRQSFQVTQEKFAFGDKFIFFEFLNMQSFKPTQLYLDLYQRFSEKAILEIGMDCNLLFAETANCIFMSEFPLDAMCASSWRLKTDPLFWYDSSSYQQQLFPVRQGSAKSFTVLIPVTDPTVRENKSSFLQLRASFDSP
jgi:hypothetical protein